MNASCRLVRDLDFSIPSFVCGMLEPLIFSSAFNNYELPEFGSQALLPYHSLVLSQLLNL